MPELSSLNHRVSILRGLLALISDGIVIGNLPSGITDVDSLPSFLPNPLIDLFKETNGPRCGLVDVCKPSVMKDIQYIIGDLNNPELYCFGQVIYEPLLVHLRNFEVFVYDYEDTGTLRSLNVKIEEFILEWLFGYNYCRLLPENDYPDRWYELLKSVHFFRKEL